MKVCEGENFFYKDVITPLQSKMRIFSYLYLGKPEIWEKPDALECRGIMFEIDEQGKPVRIASRPMEKFFNLHENKFSEYKPDDVAYVMTKLDGSLISSYIDNGYVQLKSKASIHSTQAEKANGLIYSDEYALLREHIAKNPDYTYNMEYTAPTNRIVLEYKEPRLTLLNVRNNVTGEYVPHKTLMGDAILRPYLVSSLDVDTERFVELLEHVKTAEDIEGYVCVTKDGHMFKVKTPWYVSVSDLKTTAMFPNNLIYYVAESETDDLRAAYAGEPEALERIELFEEAFREIIRKGFSVSDEFYALNAGADRGEYARRATIESQKHGKDKDYIFMCLMLSFGGVDYERMLDSLKVYYIRNYKKLIPEDKIPW